MKAQILMDGDPPTSFCFSRLFQAFAYFAYFPFSYGFSLFRIIMKTIGKRLNQCTMGQNQVILRHRMIYFPMSEGVLTSRFLLVPDHSAVVVSVESERSHRFTKEDEDKNGDGMQI